MCPPETNIRRKDEKRKAVPAAIPWSGAAGCALFNRTAAAKQRLRSVLAVGQRRLDRSHVAAAVERLAAEDNRAAVIAREQRLRLAGLCRRPGIGAARESVVRPVDGARRGQVRLELAQGHAEDIRKR